MLISKLSVTFLFHKNNILSIIKCLISLQSLKFVITQLKFGISIVYAIVFTDSTMIITRNVVKYVLLIYR